MPSLQTPKPAVATKTNGIAVSENLLLHGRRKTTGKAKSAVASHPEDESSCQAEETVEKPRSSSELEFSGEEQVSTAMSEYADEHKADMNDSATKARSLKLKKSSSVYSKYDQTMYLQASKVFAALQHQPRNDNLYQSASRKGKDKKAEKAVPYLNFETESERKLTYQLAYTTLKYQFVLEDLLDDIAFYIKYPQLLADSALVNVVFSDYMHRKFLVRELHPGEITYPEVIEVEQCITECKIKLDASLARRRIKESARKVEDLLPSSIQVKTKLTNQLLTYAWVNLHKTSMKYVISELCTSGYTILPEPTDEVEANYFCLDSLFDDTLVFSAEKSLDLSSHRLLQEGCLVIQDKTSLFGPHSAVALLNSPTEDVLLVDFNSGATAAHLSSLMHSNKKSGYVYLFGVRSPSHMSEIQDTLDRYEADNVKVIDESLEMLEYDDPRLRHVKVALIHGRCSKTAVLDPVNFVITEGEDVSILQDLSLGKPAADKVNAMTRQNLSYFRHVVRFSRMQAVIFVTRSLVDAENEKVVQKAIEAYNSDESRKHPYRITPPVFPFDSKMVENMGHEKYYRHPPTEQANGCFVAMVTKEADHHKDKESQQAIIQRATPSGLVDEDVVGEDGDKSTLTPKKTRNKSKKKLSSAASSGSRRRKKKPGSPKRVIAFGTGSSADLLAKPRLQF